MKVFINLFVLIWYIILIWWYYYCLAQLLLFFLLTKLSSSDAFMAVNQMFGGSFVAVVDCGSVEVLIESSAVNFHSAGCEFHRRASDFLLIFHVLFHDIADLFIDG